MPFLQTLLRRPPSLAARQLPASKTLPRNKPSGWLRWKRTNSTQSKAAAKNTAGTPTSRAERILSKLPPSLQKYTSQLRNAPVSNVVAFLILHELTAIVPLLGLFGFFHYTSIVPLDYILDHYGSYVADGVRRYERYFSRKGWFGFGQEGTGEGEHLARPEAGGASDAAQEAVRERWTSTDTKYKIVVEVALAYAITKALLPVRILGSLWATPWFAGVLGRARRFVGR